MASLRKKHKKPGANSKLPSPNQCLLVHRGSRTVSSGQALNLQSWLFHPASWCRDVWMRILHWRAGPKHLSLIKMAAHEVRDVKAKPRNRPPKLKPGPAFIWGLHRLSVVQLSIMRVQGSALGRHSVVSVGNTTAFSQGSHDNFYLWQEI